MIFFFESASQEVMRVFIFVHSTQIGDDRGVSNRYARNMPNLLSLIVGHGKSGPLIERKFVIEQVFLIYFYFYNIQNLEKFNHKKKVKFTLAKEIQKEI